MRSAPPEGIPGSGRADVAVEGLGAVERADLETGPSGREFVEIVESLHHELEGLRSRQRLRAVIEQAKGILVARNGVSLTEAFEQLRVMSQEHNVRLVEVAATLVGSSLPPGERLDVDLSEELPSPSPASSSAWSVLRGDDEVRAGTATAVLDARAASLADTSEAGELLRAVCVPLGADAAALYRLTVDQRLLAVTWWGYPESLMSAWQTVPPGVDIPLVRAAVTGRPVAVRDRLERARLFPRLLTMTVTGEALVAVPVRSGEDVTGALVVSWDRARDLDDDTVARVQQVARVAGAVLLRLAGDPRPELSLLHAVLDIMFDPWLLVEPVVEDDQVRGFRIRSACPDLPSAAELPGRRVLELWPGLVVSGVSSHLVTVLRTGRPWVTRLTAEQVDGLPMASGGTEVRVIRLGAALLIHWR